MFGSGRRKEEIQVTYPSSFFPRNKKGCWRICACVLFFFLFLPCLLVSSNLWHACGRSLVLKRITFCQACLSLAVIPWETKQRECWKFWDSRCVQSLIRESVCDLPIFLCRTLMTRGYQTHTATKLPTFPARFSLFVFFCLHLFSFK